MTKLMQWLAFAGMFMVVWLAVVLEKAPVSLSAAMKEVVFASPIYLLITFACYSLAVIGYRVANFNDCVEASKELQQQIKEAKEDLTSKGMTFS